jgi:hypothetical protein
MSIYINGVGVISPHSIHFEEENLKINSSERLCCIEPDYKLYFDPKQLRRMSRIVKLGSTASLMALKDAGLEKPEAIVVGTGFGCLEDTTLFLKKLIVNQEETLNPTPFIFSTHNTIAAQIGIQLNTKGYNSTYSHRDISFESALLDSMLILNEQEVKHVLVGGIDELTEDSFKILKQIGYYAQNETAGEGSCFFLLQPMKEKSSYAELKSVNVFSNTDKHSFIKKVKSLLNQYQISNIDLLIVGKQQDSIAPSFQLFSYIFEIHQNIHTLQHLSGKYATSSSFAFATALDILKNKKLSNEPFNVLIYNHYGINNHSTILLSSC